MKTIVHRLQFHNLRNSEYVIFVNQLVAIFGKFDSDKLQLKKSFERVKSMLPLLDKVKSQELSSELSDLLHDLDTERGVLIRAIAGWVKTSERLSLLAVAPHVAVLQRFLNVHGKDIGRANYNEATERTNKLLADYDLKPEVITAVLGLNLKLWFDQLRAVNTRFAQLFLQRTEEEAAREHVDARAIRTETDRMLLAFFDAIEYCSAEYEDLDYATPAKALNDLIDYYKTQVKGRITRRNAAKEADKAAPVN